MPLLHTLGLLAAFVLIASAQEPCLGPDCPCLIANCSNHATSVTGTYGTGCNCTCAVNYTGSACDTCAPNYENYPTCSEIPCQHVNCSYHDLNVTGTYVTGCKCACGGAYIGEICDGCLWGYGPYPKCKAIPCTTATDCSGHALSVKGTEPAGCNCTCRANYTGSSCNTCIANYSGYPQLRYHPMHYRGKLQLPRLERLRPRY